LADVELALLRQGLEPQQMFLGLTQQRSHAPGKLLVLDEPSKRAGEIMRGAPDPEPKFSQQASDAVDQCRALAPPPLAHAMTGQDDCCSTLFIDTKRISGCSAAMRIACASLRSFLAPLLLRKGCTRSGASSLGRCPRPVSVRAQKCAELQASIAMTHGGRFAAQLAKPRNPNCLKNNAP